MKKWQIEKRLKSIKAMHQLMINSNDERIYMNWIMVVPDEPNEFDFQDIADDPELFKECYELFCRLITKGGWL